MTKKTLLKSKVTGMGLDMCLVGCGFDPWPGHTKDYKNGPHCLPALHSGVRVGLGGLAQPMNPRRCTTAAQGSLRK